MVSRLFSFYSTLGERSLTPGIRRVWIAAGAVSIFAVAWWVSAGLFRQPADRSVALAAALDAIALVIFAPLIPGPDHHESAGTPASQTYDLTRLRSNARSLITEQVHALTDRGLLAVPWFATTSHEHNPPHLNSSVVRLARFVEGGGQLIIFGGSQSGKTTLATRLAQALAGKTGKVPLLFTMSTWDPSRIRLKDWMMQVIRSTYGLTAAYEIQSTEIALNDGIIIPLFDGLDEIDANSLDVAARSISRLIGDAPAVLTSIPTTHTEIAARVALASADEIALRPVSAAESSRYLLDGAPVDESRWRRLTTSMVTSPRSVVSQALSSPLIAWLGKTVYTSSSGYWATNERVGVDELLDTVRFPSTETIEAHLLGNLAVAVFERLKSAPSAAASLADAFRPVDAERWLGFLASHAQQRMIAFWEIRNYAPLYRLSLLFAVVGGVAIAAVGEAVRYFTGLMYLILLAGSVFGFAWSRGYTRTRARVDDPRRVGYGYVNATRVGDRRVKPKDGDLRLHAYKLVRALLAVMLACGVGLVAQLLLTGRIDALFGLSPEQMIVGVFFATVLCYAVANFGSRAAAWILLRRPALDAIMGARIGDPLRVIESDRRSGIVVFILSSVTLAAGYSAYLLIWLPQGPIWTIALTPAGAGITIFMWNEWICFKAAHVWLAFRDYLPWPLAPFLQACHEGGILRKNGNYFEFRHLRLQEGLARKAAAKL